MQLPHNDPRIYEDCLHHRRRSCATAFVAQRRSPTAPRARRGVIPICKDVDTDDARSVPLQRAAEFGDRRLLTDQEYADRKRRDDETRGEWCRGRNVRR